jgi:hypothetical protein
VTLVRKVRPALRAPKVRKACKVLRVRLARRVQSAHKVRKVCRV